MSKNARNTIGMRVDRYLFSPDWVSIQAFGTARFLGSRYASISRNRILFNFTLIMFSNLSQNFYIVIFGTVYLPLGLRTCRRHNYIMPLGNKIVVFLFLQDGYKVQYIKVATDFMLLARRCSGVGPISMVSFWVSASFGIRIKLGGAQIFWRNSSWLSHPIWLRDTIRE